MESAGTLAAMKGTMQDVPLTIPHIFDRAEQYFPHKTVTTATAAGRERVTYGEWAERTRRLGGVLDDLGISSEGRVATFAWNTARHLELYFAAPCTGRVLHTLNIRLFPEQLTYIVNHADDEVIFVDRSLLALLAPQLKTFERLRHLIVMDDGKGDIPDDLAGHTLVDYEELLAAASPVEFRVDDEHQAASMCYTSGTTGNPKGVVYSHRSTFLHTMARDDGGLPRRPRVGPHPAGGADVPRQRVGSRPRRRGQWRRPRDAGTGPVGTGDRRPRRRGAGDRRRRRPDDLDAGAAASQGPRHVCAAGDPLRRIGRTEGAVGGVPRAARAADPAGVGDDGDESRWRRCATSTSTSASCPRSEQADLRTGVGRITLRGRVPGRRAGHDDAGGP